MKFACLLSLSLCLAALPARAIDKFQQISEVSLQSPNNCYAAPLLASDGYLWGTSYHAGPANAGTVYKVKPDSPGTLQIVYSFTRTEDDADGLGEHNDDGAAPETSLVEVKHGYLWGTTSFAGKLSGGTVFQIRMSDGAFTKIVDLPKNSFNTSGLAPDGRGYLWLTARSDIYKLQIATKKLTKVLSFTGAIGPNEGFNPHALVQDGSYMWGTTGGQTGQTFGFGTVFKISLVTGKFETVSTFTGTTGAVPGSAPYTALVSDRHGHLWGTTSTGGAGDFGTLFKVNAATGEFTHVVDFTGTDGVQKGWNPRSALLLDRDLLWGTTMRGGSHDKGTIYAADVLHNTVTAMADFDGAATSDTGITPDSELVVDHHGNLIGVTYRGGPTDRGAIYQVAKDTGALSVLVPFVDDGMRPSSPLVSDGNGKYFGAFSDLNDGNIRSGTVYRYDPLTGTYTAVSEYSNVRLFSGELYVDGTAAVWGLQSDNNYGQIYRLDLATRLFSPAALFGGSGGGSSSPGGPPLGPLVSDGRGYLWGTTNSAGTGGFGTIFKIEKSTSIVTTLVQFTGDNGAHPPPAPLWFDGDRTFWGTTQGIDLNNVFGAKRNGSIFKIDAVSGDLTAVVVLDPAVPGGLYAPTTGFTSDGLGNLWIMTVNQIFKFTPATSAVTKVLTLNGGSGPNLGLAPSGALVNDGAGFLWGVTSQGGRADIGTVFKVSIATGRFATVVEFAGTKPAPPNGQNPYGYAPLGPLARDGNGDFIGVTRGYGDYTSGGTIFYRISPNQTGPDAPAVHTFAQDAVTPNNAMLHGEVDPASLATTAYFEYGLTAKYGRKTPVTSVPAGSTPQAVDHLVAKLLGHTLYHFRLVAKNSMGTTTGPDCTFTTPNTAPVGSDLTVLTSVIYEHYFQQGEIGYIGLPKVTDADHDKLFDGGETLGMFGVNYYPGGDPGVGGYSPGANFYGFDALTYSETDGFGGTATGHIYLVNKFFDGLLLSGGVTGGYLTTTITAKHAFTAALKLGGKAYALKGTFDASNHYTHTIPAKAPAVPVVVDLDLDLPHGKIEASVNNGTLWQNDLLNARSVHPPDGAQKYTAILPAPMDTTLPQGTGYGVMNVSHDASLTVAGKLGDGSIYSFGAHVRDDGTWIFYAPIKYGAGSGLIAGQIVYPSTPDGTCAGSLGWSKPTTTGTFVPQAFNTNVSFQAQLYTPPLAMHTVLDFTSAASATVNGGGLSASISHKLLVSSTNVVSITDPSMDKLALKITPATGLLGGSFLNPDTGKKALLYGVIQQGTKKGAGLFLGTAQSGTLTISP